jgi:hypothetical protein
MIYLLHLKQPKSTNCTYLISVIMKNPIVLLIFLFVIETNASAKIAQNNESIGKDVAAIQKLGIKTLSVCEPLTSQVQLWQPDYSGNGWHKTQTYNTSMVQKGRYLHVLENKQEFDYNGMPQKFNNRDTANYYFVCYLYDLEQKTALPQLYIGWVLKKDVKIWGKYNPESAKKNLTRFDNYVDKMQGTWIFDEIKNVPNEVRAKYGFISSRDTIAGAGVKMKLVITGNVYKACRMDYFPKKNQSIMIYKNYKWITIDNKDAKYIVIDYPLCDGTKIEAMDDKTISEIKDNQNRAQVILSNNGTVCSEFGGNRSNIINLLYWDDTKEALFWQYYSPMSQITFSGFCHRATGDEIPPVRKAKIGLIAMDIDDNLLKEKGIYHKNGVYVDQAPEGGAAYDAEIFPGDIILAVDNEPVTGTAKLLEILSKHQPGDEIVVKILRESLADAIMKRTVTLK